MSSEKESKKCKIKKAVCYVAGSIAVCACAAIVTPKVAPYVSGIISKKIAKISNAKKTEDDWGPVIEKKQPDQVREEDKDAD